MTLNTSQVSPQSQNSNRNLMIDTSIDLIYKVYTKLIINNINNRVDRITTNLMTDPKYQAKYTEILRSLIRNYSDNLLKDLYDTVTDLYKSVSKFKISGIKLNFSLEINRFKFRTTLYEIDKTSKTSEFTIDVKSINNGNIELSTGFLYNLGISMPSITDTKLDIRGLKLDIQEPEGFRFLSIVMTRDISCSDADLYEYTKTNKLPVIFDQQIIENLIGISISIRGEYCDLEYCAAKGAMSIDIVTPMEVQLNILKLKIVQDKIGRFNLSKDEHYALFNIQSIFNLLDESKHPNFSGMPIQMKQNTLLGFVEWKEIIEFLEQSIQPDIQYGSPEFNTIIHKLAVYSDKSMHDMYAWEYAVSPNEVCHYDYDKELALMERKDTQPDKARKKGILNKWQTLIKL